MAEKVTGKPGRNGHDPEKIASFISRIENLNKDIATKKSEHMAACKEIRSDIKIVLDEAKDDGISKTALKALVKQRELERKVEACRDNLESEEQHEFDKIEQALGQLADTELGQAAVKEAA